MTALVIDCETTNLEAPEVIELAMTRVDLTDGTWTQRSDVLVERFRPSGVMDAGSVAVHHILPSELEEKRSSSQAQILFRGFSKSDSYIIGHSVDFDVDALGGSRMRRICTLALCRSLWPEVSSHRLTAMVYHLKGLSEMPRALCTSAHGAEADVELCLVVLMEIAKKLNVSNLDSLWFAKEQSRIPKTMPFGKHNGDPITSLTVGYRRWLMDLDDLDKFLRLAVERSLRS